MTRALVPRHAAEAPPTRSPTEALSVTDVQELIARVKEIPLRDVEQTLAQPS